MSDQDFKERNCEQNLLEELIVINEILQSSNEELRKKNLEIPLLKQEVKELQKEKRMLKEQLSKPGDANEYTHSQLKSLALLTQYDYHKEKSIDVKVIEVSKDKEAKKPSPN